MAATEIAVENRVMTWSFRLGRRIDNQGFDGVMMIGTGCNSSRRITKLGSNKFELTMNCGSRWQGCTNNKMVFCNPQTGLPLM